MKHHQAQEPGVLERLYQRLLSAFGRQHWWPAPPGREAPFEVMVGAVLTQNTNWRNVERAIANLRAAGVLAPETLSRLSEAELARLVQPSGFFRVKARRLTALLDWLMATAGGDLGRLRRRRLAGLREELLALPGIGPETADSILLYALGKPTFVVDAYTRRVLGRHGLIGPGPTRRGAGSARYDEIKALFESSLPHQAPLFNEYHALLVELGKRFCRPRPRCAGCPARTVLGEPTL